MLAEQEVQVVQVALVVLEEEGEELALALLQPLTCPEVRLQVQAALAQPSTQDRLTLVLRARALLQTEAQARALCPAAEKQHLLDVANANAHPS